MDADGQHRPEDVPSLLDALPRLRDGRRRPNQRGRGPGCTADLANAVYNAFASYVVKHPVPDLTSGFRAMDVQAARRFVYLLPNTFSYPTTITLAMFRAGLPVQYVPIEAQPRVGKSHIRIFRDGARFLLILTKIAHDLQSDARVPAALGARVRRRASAGTATPSRPAGRFTNAPASSRSSLSVILFALALISESGRGAALRPLGAGRVSTPDRATGARPLRVVWFGSWSRGPGYPRSTDLIAGLRELGHEVVEVHAPLFDYGAAQRVSLGSGSAVGAARCGSRGGSRVRRGDSARGWFRLDQVDVVVVGHGGPVRRAAAALPAEHRARADRRRRVRAALRHGRARPPALGGRRR